MQVRQDRRFHSSSSMKPPPKGVDASRRPGTRGSFSLFGESKTHQRWESKQAEKVVLNVTVQWSSKRSTHILLRSAFLMYGPSHKTSGVGEEVLRIHGRNETLETLETCRFAGSSRLESWNPQDEIANGDRVNKRSNWCVLLLNYVNENTRINRKELPYQASKSHIRKRHHVVRKESPNRFL